MKTTWLIQSTGFNNSFLMEILNTLQKLNYNYKDFGLIPFSDQIFNLENILETDTIFITKGGTKILSLLNSASNITELNDFLKPKQILYSEYYIKKLKESIDYNVEKFSQEYYSKLNLPLLNSEAKYFDYSEIFNTSFKDKMFVKPNRDLKAFNGGIIEKNETIEKFILRNYPQSFYKEEKIIISPLKKIFSEYRFFIIEDKIISGSQYRLNGKGHLDNVIPDYIFQIAKEYAKLYSPSDIFVMDLADTEDGVFIIEYNCWNASGVYHSDIKKLFQEINEYKLSKKNY